MHASLSQQLSCLDCSNSDLVSNSLTERNNEIIEGYINCTNCGAVYPIYNGVPILFSNKVLYTYLTDDEKTYTRKIGIEKILLDRLIVTSKNKQVEKMFHLYEYTWPMFQENKSLQIDDYHQSLEQFMNFNQVTPEDLNGKHILIAGGGFGREVSIINEHFQPASITVIDLAMGCFNVFDHLPRAPSISYIRGDMTDRLLKKKFDTVISDHVMQHVYDIKAALSTLGGYLSPGGRLSINHYSKENNGLMIYIIEPLKRLLSRLSPRGLWVLSLWPGIVLYALIHALYVPIASMIRGKQLLPLQDNMLYWSKFSFYLLRVTAFDLLATPITYFRSYDELNKIMHELKMEQIEIRTHAGTFWCIGALKGS